MINRRCVLVLTTLLLARQTSTALPVNPDEKSEVQRWVAAKFNGSPQPQPDLGYFQPKLESGLPEKGARRGNKLKIADVEFDKGIHCPSMGTVEVHLPAPGDRFSAMVGVDSSDIGYYSGYGHGNVTLVISIGGKEVYRSPVMHDGQNAIPVNISLQGSGSLMLTLIGTDENNKWYQAAWNQLDLADAKITLKDGRPIALDSLPMAPLSSAYSAAPPFSFIYSGEESSDLLRSWQVQRSSRDLDEQRTEYTEIYKDPGTGLQVRLVGIAYHDFPAVEWTVYLKNTGSADTPIIENLQALDTRLERNGDGEFLLHHNNGAPATPDDYEPYETPLPPGSDISLSGKGGRPSNKDLPYFNLAWPNQGVIVVVGWPGQWAGRLERDKSNGIQIRAGQELTHFKLLPGEEVRTPRIVLLFWTGEWERSQNLWRHWMMAHNMPHPNGKLPPPQWAANTSHEFVEMMEATDQKENAFIDRYISDGLKPDYFWMDAGWYLNNGSWVNTGTWEVDPQRFPHGLRAVSDYAHSKGIKIIVWFEPERVTPGSWLYEHHPEWLLTTKQEPGNQLYDRHWRLFNFGDPQAREWMVEHVDKIITEQGIDLYRQDFNMDPLNYWRSQDAPDRQGITEVRYVTGLLEYWDELHRRHPDMLMDECASGGRRNDIDSLRHSVPLTRSDYLLEPVEPISQQMQTLGIAQWIPYFGTGISGEDPYQFRSQMTPAIVSVWDLRDDTTDVLTLRKLISQWRAVSPNYYGNYYALTSYSLSNTDWAALQFDRPEAGEGFVEIFRRSKSPAETEIFRLRGLDPAARYQITNLDDGSKEELSGKDLLNGGIRIHLDHVPDSALISYKKLD
jgi:alpha-galactosidase